MKSRVAELRREKNLSHENLAEAMLVQPQTIVAIEERRYTPSLMLAHRIAKYFELSIEEVFDFSEVGEF